MTFQVKYGRNDLLTGVVGRDGMLYVLVRDVKALLDTKSLLRNHKMTVFDATGELSSVSKTFLRKRIISYDCAMNLLRESEKKRCRTIASTLTDGTTKVCELWKNDPRQLHAPTILILRKNGRDSEFFIVWYEFFKQEVMEKVYGVKREDIDEFMLSFYRHAPEEENESSEVGEDETSVPVLDLPDTARTPEAVMLNFGQESIPDNVRVVYPEQVADYYLGTQQIALNINCEPSELSQFSLLYSVSLALT